MDEEGVMTFVSTGETAVVVVVFRIYVYNICIYKMEGLR